MPQCWTKVRQRGIIRPAACRYPMRRLGRFSLRLLTLGTVAQTKVMNGLLAFVGVWALAMLVTLPLAPITFFAVPVAMW